MLSDHFTPRRCVQWAMRVLYVTAPLALVTLLVWAFQWWDAMRDRPYLVIMVYLALLGVSVGAGITAAIGASQLAIGKAFAAGMQVGRQGQPARPAPARPPGLRVVE